MGKIVVRTKFNKTGRRVLTTPLQEKWVCAPADRRYKKAYYAIESEFKKKKDKPLYPYIEKISHFIASYVASSSVSAKERYRIVKFLSESSLRETGPMAIGDHMDARRWSRQLGDISGLSHVEEEAWQTYVEESQTLWKERENALNRASYAHDVMKRALWKEISDQIHREFHPEDNKPTK
jgi:hypothetical protein